MHRLKKAVLSVTGLLSALSLGLGIYNLSQSNWTWALIFAGTGVWGSVDAWRDARAADTH